MRNYTMKKNFSFTEYISDTFDGMVAWLQCSKLYLFFSGITAWFFSTYQIHGILCFFALATTLDTITRIHADSVKLGLKFNPFKMYFWLRIHSSGLKAMGRKIFLEYTFPIIMATGFDYWVLKSKFHFDVMSLHLNIPSAGILFFALVETWSIFENLEDAGHVNWTKKIFNVGKKHLPSKLKDIFAIFAKNK